MNEEAGFLSAIGQAPDEDTIRLAYADWLDEQPDPSGRPKAEFVRLETRLATESVEDYTTLTAHLHQLAATLEPDWLAVVSRPSIERCRSRLLHQCPGTWSRLIPSDLTARTCGACSRTVRYARTPDEVAACVRSGEPVVVSLGVPRLAGDVRPWSAPACAPDLAALVERKRLSRAGEEHRPPPRPDERPEQPPIRAPAPRRQNARHRRLEREDWEEME